MKLTEKEEVKKEVELELTWFKLSMIYGFAYLGIVLGISAFWVVLAVLKKPEFIEKPLEELKNKIRPFLNSK